jgi:hypothetical protein
MKTEMQKNKRDGLTALIQRERERSENKVETLENREIL